MKTTLLSVAAAAALSIASFAHAGPQAAAEAAGESVKIQKPSAYRMDKEEFADFKATYALSNGDYMKLSDRYGRFYADADGVPVEIFAVAPNRFVSKAGATLVFSDDATAVTIGNYERLAANGKLPANTIVVARR